MAASASDTAKAQMKDDMDVSQRGTGWRRYFSLPVVLTGVYLVLGAY